jgi:hypothetical protein
MKWRGEVVEVMKKIPQFTRAGLVQSPDRENLRLLLSATVWTALIAIALAGTVDGSLLAQSSSGQGVGDSAIVRPCKQAVADDKPGKGAKHPTKGRSPAEVKLSPACLEVKAGALEVQEYLQSYVRENAWKIGEEEISEDSWTFVRYLDNNELPKFAKTEDAGAQVDWTEAKGLVTVRTNDAGGGFQRVEISARFEGRGQTKEAFARPFDDWQLASKGTMEKEMLSALENHLNSLH